MHRSIFLSCLGLMAEASDPATGAASAGGAASPAPVPAPAATPPAVNPDTETQGAAPTATKPPGPIDRALAMLKDKSTLNAQITSLTAERDRLTTDLANVRSELARVTGERDGYASQIQQLTNAVTALEGEKVDVATAVTHELAAIGVPEKNLPAASAGGGDSGPKTEAELNAALAECKTHAERSAMVAAWDKRTAKKAN